MEDYSAYPNQCVYVHGDISSFGFHGSSCSQGTQDSAVLVGQCKVLQIKGTWSKGKQRNKRHGGREGRQENEGEGLRESVVASPQTREQIRLGKKLCS